MLDALTGKWVVQDHGRKGIQRWLAFKPFACEPDRCVMNKRQRCTIDSLTLSFSLSPGFLFCEEMIPSDARTKPESVNLFMINGLPYSARALELYLLEHPSFRYK